MVGLCGFWCFKYSMQSIFLRNNCKKLNSSRCIPGKWWTAIQWFDQQTRWQNVVFTFLPVLFANKPKMYINFFWLSFQLIHPGHCLRNQSPCQGSAMHYLLANHFFLIFIFISIIIYCSRMRKSHRTESTTTYPYDTEDVKTALL